MVELGSSKSLERHTSERPSTIEGKHLTSKACGVQVGSSPTMPTTLIFHLIHSCLNFLIDNKSL